MTTPTEITPTATTPPEASEVQAGPSSSEAENKPQPSFVKLAMRNMVYQGGKSIFHFALTTVGLLGLLVGLAFITR
jgi:Protein of unknown function (DUF3285)